jgi:hypothetical protein
LNSSGVNPNVGYQADISLYHTEFGEPGREKMIAEVLHYTETNGFGLRWLGGPFPGLVPTIETHGQSPLHVGFDHCA